MHYAGIYIACSIGQNETTVATQQARLCTTESTTLDLKPVTHTRYINSCVAEDRRLSRPRHAHVCVEDLCRVAS